VPKKRYRSKPNREAAVAPRHAGPAREADEATPTDKATQQLAQEREKVRHLEAEVQALRAAAAATHAARLEMQPAAGSAGAPPVPSLWPGHAPTTWWRTLRQTLAAVLFLRGRQALDLPTLVTAFEVDGITGVQQTLDQHGSAAAARARHLLALAKHYQKLNQPGRAAILGRAAYDINPQPTVAKWLAFRLFDAGHIHEPLTLLQGAASTCVFSASEGKRVEEIKTLAKLAQELPAVPAKAEPAYEPTDGALLYVAASCLPYHNSGYTNRTHELNLALKAAGGNVTVVTRPGYPWDRPDRTGLPDRLSTHNEGLDYLHIRTPTLAAPLDEYFAQAANSIARVAKKDRVAAIHAASNHVNALPALLAARRLGLPFVYEMRGLWDMTRAAKIEEYENSDRYRLGIQLEALVAKEADRVFVISEALGQYIQKEWGVDPAKIQILPNCVNPETIERAKQMAGPKPEVFTVGYAGSLVSYEGLDLLIDALAELKRSGTMLHARIIGDGPEREKLEERAKSSGLNEQVRFLGRLPPEKARARLAETHAAVLPRRSSAVCQMIPPLKLVEARALGLPLVVSDLEVLLAELQSGESVAPFAAGDISSLAGRLSDTAATSETCTGRAFQTLPIERLWQSHAQALMHFASALTPPTLTEDRKSEKRESLMQPSQKRIFSPNLQNARKQRAIAQNSLSDGSSITAIFSQKPRVLSLLDEFSSACFSQELELIPLDRSDWRRQIDGADFDFFLAESCWRGNRGTWSYSMTSRSHANARDFQAALLHLSRSGKTTVFWNKEDPPNYERFKDIAAQFNLIFTTDRDCIARYRDQQGLKAVYELPFAASTVLHHPIATGPRLRRVFFAGSWNGLKYPHRAAWLKSVLHALKEYNALDIFDRYFAAEDASLRFPSEFTAYVRGAIPYDKIADAAYRSYAAAINVNSVSHSPTMVARRVYELAACGTLIFSSPSPALAGELSRVVTVGRAAEDAAAFMAGVLSDKTEDYVDAQRRIALGVRFAHSSHTFAHRAQAIVSHLADVLSEGPTPTIPLPPVTMIVVSRRPLFLERVLQTIRCQTHAPKEVIFVCHSNAFCRSQVEEKIAEICPVRVLSLPEHESFLADGLNMARAYVRTHLVAKIDDDDFYGPNYLRDTALAFTYTGASLVGKRTMFCYLESSDATVLRFPGKTYCTSNSVHGGTLVWDETDLKHISFPRVRQGTDSGFLRQVKASGKTIISIDPFNFVHVRYHNQTQHTWQVSDAEFEAKTSAWRKGLPHTAIMI